MKLFFEILHALFPAILGSLNHWGSFEVCVAYMGWFGLWELSRISSTVKKKQS